MEGIRTSAIIVCLLNKRRADILSALLHGSRTGQSRGFDLLGDLLVLLALLTARKDDVAEAENDEGAKDDGNDNAARVERVVGLHADILVVAVHGADVAVETVACRDGDVMAFLGLEVAVNDLVVAGQGGGGAGLEASLAELVAVACGRGRGRWRGRVSGHDLSWECGRRC